MTTSSSGPSSRGKRRLSCSRPTAGAAFASWLIGNGESLAYVKEQLGHHSIQITVDTYGHLVPGANRKAVNALDDPEWDLCTPINAEHVDTAQQMAIPAHL